MNASQHLTTDEETAMLKLLDSEKTYKLRVKEDSEIFHKVLLTFDGTEGGPNTYLKFRDKKGTSGVMESDSWDDVSADPATNNTYSDNSTGNKNIYYAPEGNFEGRALMRRREGAVRFRRLEKEMAFVKVEQALIPHFSKLQRQPAALHAKVIRKLLP